MRKKNNKKGSIESLLTIGILVFSIAIGWLVGSYFYDNIRNQEVFQQYNFTNSTFDAVEEGIQISDNMILFIMVGMGILVLG